MADDRAACVSCSIRRLTLEYWSGSRSSAELTKVLRAMQALFRTCEQLILPSISKFPKLTLPVGWKSDVSSGHADPDEQGAWIFNVMSRELPSS